MSPAAFVSPIAVGINGFASSSAITRPQTPLTFSPAPPQRANVSMISEKNRAAKAAKIEAVREKLARCDMIFSAPLEGLKVSDMGDLKSNLPSTTTVATVKNTLMRRAIADSPWEVAGELATQSSIWFFVEDDIKGSVEAYTKFAKDAKREDMKGGVLEGTKYDSDGIEQISKLPSKKELMAKVAIAVKMVPTKLGKTINMVPTKVARAVKLAIADDSEDAPAEE